MNKDDNDNKIYKSISDVAKLLNLYDAKNGKLKTHILRFWEKEFKQIKPKIFSGRRRYYDDKTIEIIKKIKYLLKDKGLTIKGAKMHLGHNNSDLDVSNNTTINKKNILKSKVNKISKILKNLKSK